MVDFDADLGRVADRMDERLRELDAAIARGDRGGACSALEAANDLARDFVRARQATIDAIAVYAESVLARAEDAHRRTRALPTRPPLPAPPAPVPEARPGSAYSITETYRTAIQRGSFPETAGPLPTVRAYPAEAGSRRPVRIVDLTAPDGPGPRARGAG